jgi:S1-C subfamily serine protease
MKRFLLSLVMLFALVGSQNDLAAKATWDKAVKKVQQSLVYIQSGPAVCTGFVIDEERRYVMTAAHCRLAPEIWADRSASRIVGFDSNKDMMVLQVEELDPSRKRLKLAKKEARAQTEIVAIGFALGLENPTVIRGIVLQRSGMLWGAPGNPYVIVRPTFIGGQSGGPAVNINGDVVLIIQMGSDGANIGLGTSAKLMRERMGRFFA